MATRQRPTGGMMRKFFAWIGKDERLDRVIEEQHEVLKEASKITKKTNKLHDDTQRSVDSVLRTINNTWGVQ